jgi:hypothetical protein
MRSKDIKKKRIRTSDDTERINKTRKSLNKLLLSRDRVVSIARMPIITVTED